MIRLAFSASPPIFQLRLDLCPRPYIGLIFVAKCTRWPPKLLEEAPVVSRCKGSCLKRNMNIYIYNIDLTLHDTACMNVCYTIHFSNLADESSFSGLHFARSLLGTQLMTVAWMGRPPRDEHHFPHRKES